MKRLPFASCALIACASTFSLGCHRTSEADPLALADVIAEPAETIAPTAVRPGPHPARCRVTELGARIDAHPGRDDIDLGDAIETGPNAYAVGLVHGSPSGRVAAVALLHGDASAVRVVDFGATVGDAPPPQLATCGGRIIAAALRLPDRDAGLPPVRGPASQLVTSQELALYAADSAEPRRPLATIPQRRDDSLAFDVACASSAGAVVWDETEAAPPHPTPHGVIRAVPFEIGPVASRQDGVRDVSPRESDAEMPRVVAWEHGFFVLWIARSAEASSAAAPGPEEAAAPEAIEATGEARTHGWIEMVPLDAAGKVAGAVLRLTPAAGHVSAYDVQARVDHGKPAVLVVARDDVETADGSGGTLLRVRVRGDVVDAPALLPTDGLGRGAPTFVDLPARWIAWIGPREQLRLLPIDASGEPSGAASAEDALDEVRPLLTLPGGVNVPLADAPWHDASARASTDAGLETRLLVAAPADTGAQLRVFGCAP